MSPVVLVEISVVLLLAGALASLACARRRELAGWVAVAGVAAASLPLWALIVLVLTAGTGEEESLLAIPAFGARLAVRVDPLSALFLAIGATVAILATIYSVKYMTHLQRDTVAKFYPVLLVFFAAIIGVLVVADFLFFLVFWELMTLTSFFLVTFERESPASQRAGLKYFLITHAATLCLIVACLVLWRQAGSFGFAPMRDALATLLDHRPVLAHVVLALFFLGFATKAGVLPMGDWLPDAHPAAPSGVSATLSGALVKLGIYGLVRVFCSFLPVSGAAEAWGFVLALAGTVSLFVGTLTALKQTDTKRLMAFHTIGQIGYICLGIGVGVACLRTSPALAALGLVGALFHAVNHACFKSCLFLGAGAVIYRTGERNMDVLGGLGADMPVTAGATTVASLSIAGVPPFNGFASKWLIVATCTLAGLKQPIFLVLAVIAMFISLATLASFLKVLGAVFLGTRRNETPVEEVPTSMLVPQLVFAGLCVLLGVLPQLPLRVLHGVVASVLPIAIPPTFAPLARGTGIGVLVDGAARAFWAPLAMVALLAVFAGIAYAIQRVGRASERTVPVWTCGEEVQPASARVPASSYYLPFKHAFGGIYPTVRVRAPHFPAALRRAFDLDAWLYRPSAGLVDRAARVASRSHVGVPQVYLLWIIVGAAVLLALLIALGQ